jgi:CheY-like chemotaxis protein
VSERTLSVLVVDDDSGMREALSDVLEGEGHQVAAAVDGAHALERLSQGPEPCVVLLDWAMPRVDGEAFLTARADIPSLRGIPVVVISGNRVPVTDARIQIFLPKPFTLHELLTRLREVCSRHCPPERRAACPNTGRA